MVLHLNNIKNYLKDYKFVSEDTIFTKVIEKKRRNLYFQVFTKEENYFVKQFIPYLLDPKNEINNELTFYENYFILYSCKYDIVPTLYGVDSINQILITENLHNLMEISFDEFLDFGITMLLNLHNLSFENYPKFKPWIFRLDGNGLLEVDNIFFQNIIRTRNSLEVIKDLSSSFKFSNLCHGDVKIDNFLKDKFLNFKLIDFELSGISDPFWDFSNFLHSIIYKFLLLKSSTWVINDTELTNLNELKLYLQSATIKFKIKAYEREKLLLFLGAAFMNRIYEWTIHKEKFIFDEFYFNLTLELLNNPIALYKYFYVD